MTRRHEYLSRPLNATSRRLARKHDKAEVHGVYQKSRKFPLCRGYWPLYPENDICYAAPPGVSNTVSDPLQKSITVQ